MTMNSILKSKTNTKENNEAGMYLWLINVRNREALKVGKASLSRNNGFASISFLSSTSIMLRADFVSPYLESCSFCLLDQKNIIEMEGVKER